ncbi:arsenate reductase ArsC [Nitrospira moscoviensis]|jgi:arsenate reductase (thioredoxin)|uniref:Arsenate reductase n=1 Tax=Nitrospira moscoviensis TaxID=42253 RepID=A0A0K2GHA3_NITMO|nr:arsenate reductase ArsC [Nitrospira moscoviensis]ALA60234.1 Arsenate reductase [Nitrospira moscoviensis]
MKQRVLFLCTGNSARSQMAEGLLRHLAGDRYDVFSAGTHPVGLNPGAVEAMQDIGIDISKHRSKHMNEFTDRAFEYVITVCDRAKDSCPRWPHAATLIHWSFEDPAAVTGTADERRHAFRTVRDQIKQQIELFITAR